MNLEKFKEKRKVENVRSLMNRMFWGYVLMLTIGYLKGCNLYSVVATFAISVLYVANIYFSRAEKLQRKYEKFITSNVSWLDAHKDGINEDDIFEVNRLNMIKRLGNTILNDTLFDQDGYDVSVVMVFAICICAAFTNGYVIFKNLVPHSICIGMIVIVSLEFISIINHTSNRQHIRIRTKKLITDKGWDEKWKR